MYSYIFNNYLTKELISFSLHEFITTTHITKGTNKTMLFK